MLKEKAKDHHQFSTLHRFFTEINQTIESTDSRDETIFNEINKQFEKIRTTFIGSNVSIWPNSKREVYGVSSSVAGRTPHLCVLLCKRT